MQRLKNSFILIYEKDSNVSFISITPNDPEQRGSQLSLKFSCDANKVHGELEKRGVIVSLKPIAKKIKFKMLLTEFIFKYQCDFRAPDVLRFAPTALYTKFSEIHRLNKILKECFKVIKI